MTLRVQQASGWASAFRGHRRERFLQGKHDTSAVTWTQDAIQPGTGFTTKPGVAATRRTPGYDELRSKPQRGFTRSPLNPSDNCGTPFGVQSPDVDRNPGCAAPRRPWALLCNPVGVFKTLVLPSSTFTKPKNTAKNPSRRQPSRATTSGLENTAQHGVD